MRRVFGEGVELELEDPGEKTSLRKVFAGGYAKRIVFLGILTLCQVVPMYAIYTFGPEIMTAFGLGEGHEAILGESVVSLFFLIGSIPAMFWLNSMGRRPLLIRSLALMAVGLVILGVFPDAPLYVIILGFGLYAFFSGGRHPAMAVPQRAVSHRGARLGGGHRHRVLAHRHYHRHVRHAAVPGRLRHRPHHADRGGPRDPGPRAVGLHAPETKGKSLLETSSLDEGDAHRRGR